MIESEELLERVRTQILTIVFESAPNKYRIVKGKIVNGDSPDFVWVKEGKKLISIPTERLYYIEMTA